MDATNSAAVTLESLRSVPLFASLDDKALSRLRDLLEIQMVKSGSVLFHAGDEGTAMYLIERGVVRIHISGEDGSQVVLAEMARGDFFGEIAILDGRPRSADAEVIEDALLAVLSREHFLAFLEENSAFALKMLAALTDRLRKTDELISRRVSRNVNEEEAARSTLADRMADLIAEFGGSWKFIFSSTLFLALWILLNTWLMQDKGFDPYPYVLLNLVLAMIAGLQAPVIMMSQNRQAEKDRIRADLDYQVNLKNELALTEVLRRLDVLETESLPILFEKQNASIGR